VTLHQSDYTPFALEYYCSESAPRREVNLFFLTSISNFFFLASISIAKKIERSKWRVNGRVRVRVSVIIRVRVRVG
jgi:hypothetical protein